MSAAAAASTGSIPPQVASSTSRPQMVCRADYSGLLSATRNGVLWFGITSGLARLNACPRRSRAATAGVDQRGAHQGCSPARSRRSGSDNCRSTISRHTRTSCRSISSASVSASGDVLRYQYRLEAPMPDWSALERAADRHLREPFSGPLQVSRPRGELRRGRERRARDGRLHDSESRSGSAGGS